MIKIIEENKSFIVLIKPAGHSVHNQSPSVAEFLKKNNKALHFVNRLDQETSGLMLVGKTPEMHNSLSEALEDGKKYYRALLRSPWTQNEKEILWSWPISDKAEGRDNPKGLSADRQEAATQVQILRSNKYFTEVYIELMTGRQHQIRKHSAIAKHPVVGDKRYNDKKYNENIAKLYKVNRMHLHAEKIEFNFENKDYKYENKYNLDLFFSDASH